MPQRAPIRPSQSAPAEIITNMNGGFMGYVDPTIANPTQWYAGSNVFSGPFGYLQRARFANIVVPPGQNIAATIFSVAPAATPTADFPILNQLITTTAAHGFSAGMLVTQTGSSSTLLNSTFVISSIVDSTDYTIMVPGGPVLSATGGTAVAGYPLQAAAYTTLKFYAIPGLSNYMLADVNGRLLSFDSAKSYSSFFRQTSVDPSGFGSAQLNGPWSRETLNNIIYEVNGTVKQAGRAANAQITESFGLDAPDVSPQVTITAGTSQALTNIQRSNSVVTATVAALPSGIIGGNSFQMLNVAGVSDTSFNGTFVLSLVSGSGPFTITWQQVGQNTALISGSGNLTTQITKSVGRSYAIAWENASKNHVSAPSPVTQYIQYANQYGTVTLQEVGTITATGGPISFTITGTNTAFSTAWVGKYLLANGSSGRRYGLQITSVASATSMTVTTYQAGISFSNANFMIYDPSMTHIRLYASADGGATYFRIQRNVFDPTQTTLVATGLGFTDMANSEPPNFPFTTETSQLYNVPPPVGSFIKQYQSRLLIFGGTIPGQTFFYTNIESTLIGQPQESVAPLNQITLPIKNANLSGMADFPGSLIIWSDKEDMFRLTGLLIDNTPLGSGGTSTGTAQGATLSRLPYKIGCANPFAVEVTPLGALWISTNKEMWLYTDTYAPKNIGRPIQNLLNNIPPTQLSQVRLKYYRSQERNWVAVAFPNGSANNVLALLDLDLLASNGQPSFFTFDMATNNPSFWIYNVNCPALEVMYEAGGVVRLFVGATDLIRDVDYQTGYFGTETAVGGTITSHAWGNDTAFLLKRPSWLRFNTNSAPSLLASEGWSFGCFGIDDDVYTFTSPLALSLVPGPAASRPDSLVPNDTSTNSGSPSLSLGSPFRHSPELFRIGGVNFVMGRRLQFQVNFPTDTGLNHQFRSIQIGFGPSPPR